MKKQGQKYLPALPSHRKAPHQYNEYLLRTLFFNAMGRTVEGLAGSIFQKPPQWKMSKESERLFKDITHTGVSGEMFALRTTRNILTTGRWGILVDMASADKGTNKKKAIDGTPYWCGYRAEDIIAWRTELGAGGAHQLTMVVLREYDEAVSPDDEFAVERIEQYRVLRLDDGEYSQEIWRKPPNKHVFVKAEEMEPLRRGTKLDFIPFVFMNATTIEPTVEKPPLIDLADVNLSHYRTMADLEHGRHYTALPTPWISGSLAGDDQGDLEIGSGVAWMLSENGSAGMLEFSGAGLASLVTADQEKRKMMATLGARLLEDVGAAETATAVSMRHGGEHATLRTIAAVVEQGLTRALSWVEWWIGTAAKPEDLPCEIKLNKEFFASKASPGEIATAIQALQAEQISYQTFYNILSEGGWSREGVDYEQEREDIDADRKVNMAAAAEVQKAMAELQAETAPPPPVGASPEAPDGDGGDEPSEEELAAAEEVTAEAEEAGEDLTEEEFYARVAEKLKAGMASKE